MPYITKEQRDDLEPVTESIKEGYIRDSGELNYLITTLVHSYLRHKEAAIDKPSYAFYNDVLGALEGAKLELYRRKIIPYEELKKKQNGDVV